MRSHRRLAAALGVRMSTSPARIILRTSVTATFAVAVLGACVVAAAGAGAGGGIYLTQRGVECVVAVSVDRAAPATPRAFAELKMHQQASAPDHDGAGRERDRADTAR